MIRWLAWIRLFDFEVRHVPGTKHIIIDDLSRRPRTKSDDIDEEYIKNINDFITAQLDILRIFSIEFQDEQLLLDGYYSE